MPEGIFFCLVTFERTNTSVTPKGNAVARKAS